MTTAPGNRRSIGTLLEIMARLRDPEDGCPWDREQTLRSIAPYTIEEAHEVADAIERGDLDDIRDELGDLLLQVVFHARIAEEAGSFDFADVVEAICDKMIRRHPHVFADAEARSVGAVRASWNDIKAAEKAARGKKSDALLDEVPGSLPALTQAIKLQNKAAKVGFDWPDTSLVLDKLNEEMLELSHELASGGPQEKIEEELGDLLFVYANLARHLNIDPEAALRRTNVKFRRRFGHVEKVLAASGRPLAGASLEEMDRLWDEAKRLECGDAAD